jgi:peptidoglycan-N-acetylglucosamine deacetylase
VENNKSFLWPQGILIGLLALGGSLSLGLMLPIISNTKIPAAKTSESISSKNVDAKVATVKRLEGFKSAMLSSWQLEASAKGLGYSIPARFLGATIEEAKLSQGQKVIALTFDDGPWPENTVKVLDILKQNNIKGTFFVIGQNLKNYPDYAKRIVAEGHVIGNHTWHHWYHFMNPQTAAYEVDQTSELIYKTTGVRTNLFRPPGGIMHNGVVAHARAKKYSTIMWSADSIDYSRPAVPRLLSNVLKESRPGGIVLMHDGGGDRSHTITALPQLIDHFRKEGYRFVTVPELLDMQEKDLKLIANKK